MTGARRYGVMKRVFLLFLFTACASQQMPARYDSPVVAYPVNAMMQSREVADGFDNLIRMAGYGKRSDERAGFLVLVNGHIQLQEWPANNRYHAAEWNGSIPAGTVALAHTHPQQYPDASVQDRSEAKRLGIPIFVLTPQSVVMIDPRDGKAMSVR